MRTRSATRRGLPAPQRWSVPNLDAADDLAAAAELALIRTSVNVRFQFVRFSIAAMTPAFGALAAVMMFSDEGPNTTATRWLWIAVIASTIPGGLIVARVDPLTIWWARRSKPWGVSHLFVLYGDVGVSTILLTNSVPESGLSGAVLFAILSAYAAHFCSPFVRNLHMVATTAVIIGLSVNVWRTGDYTMAAVVGRFLIAVVVVNGTVVLQSMFTAGIRRSMRSTLLHAHQDSLTLLWNRRGFTYWAAATAMRSKGAISMLFVDIDDYKSINDRHGHHVGDDVLKLAARRLEAAVGNRGVLARTGGDEFAVATELASDDLLALGESIRAGIHQEDDAVPVTTSIGVAAGPRDAAAIRQMGDAESIVNTILHAADTALYEAKQSGRNCVAFIDLEDADPRAQVVIRE